MDSGSAVTALSCPFYQALVRAGAGGCATTHAQEVARRQRFTDRDLGMLILCGVVLGTPDGVCHSGM